MINLRVGEFRDALNHLPLRSERAKEIKARMLAGLEGRDEGSIVTLSICGIRMQCNMLVKKWDGVEDVLTGTVDLRITD